MRTITDKIQDKLNEDVGRVPMNNSNIEIDSDVDQALDTIADFFKTNLNKTNEKEITRTAMNVMAAFDNKFNGQYTKLGSIIYDAIKKY